MERPETDHRDEDTTPVEEPTDVQVDPPTETHDTSAGGEEPTAPGEAPGAVAASSLSGEGPDAGAPAAEPDAAAPVDVPEPSPTFAAPSAAPATPPSSGGELSPSAETSTLEQKPEIPVAGAFAGGLVLAILLRRLGS